MAKPCLVKDCPEYASSGSRCRIHQRQFDSQRNADPKRQAYKDPLYRSYVKDSKCAKCGSTERLTKDHRTPISKGGTNDHSNLQTYCVSCNSSKGNKTKDNQ